MRFRLFLAVTTAALMMPSLAACSIPVQSSSGQTATPTQTVTVTVPATTSSTTGVGALTDPTSLTSIVAPDPTASVSGPRAGTLTLSQFFQPETNWNETAFGVADRQNVLGIGSRLGCYDTRVLELRLSNAFKEIDFEVGQANNSASSEGTLIVEINANGDRREAKRIPFNKIQPFQVNVENVNALRIVFTLESNKQCNAIAVFLNGRLQ